MNESEYQLLEPINAKIVPGANNVVYERIKVIPNVNKDKYTSDSAIQLTIPTTSNRWRRQLGT